MESCFAERGANNVASSKADGSGPQTNRKPNGSTMSPTPADFRLPAPESSVVRIRRVISSPNYQCAVTLFHGCHGVSVRPDVSTRFTSLGQNKNGRQSRRQLNVLSARCFE